MMSDHSKTTTVEFYLYCACHTKKEMQSGAECNNFGCFTVTTLLQLFSVLFSIYFSPIYLKIPDFYSYLLTSFCKDW